MALTEAALSPDLFRRWAGISLVAGALERRVWVKTGPRLTYPNLYTLLVAPPGVGKYVIEDVRELWTATTEPGTKVPAFKVAPDSMSKASLMDTLVKSKQVHLPPSGTAETHHSLLIAAEEFSVLLPAYDLEYIGVLNSIYNNKPLHEESRRTGSVRELRVEFPQLNILAGVQPGWLASVFPEEAWSTGLASRLIMIYSPERPRKPLFDDPGEPEELRALVLARLGAMSQLYGPLRWEPEAVKMIHEWDRDDGPPTPQHSKLVHYVRRRTLHVLKLAIVSAVARSGVLVMRLVDIERAIAWLVEAERLMPDIFRAMVGKSDSQVIEEMHYYVTALWAKAKGQPVHERMIFGFLAQRVPSDKIETILRMAERANIVARVAGTADQYVPKPRHEHGLE